MVDDIPITVLYDGGCSVCAREARFWRKRDRHHRLHLVDISADDFEAGDYGLSNAAVQSQMHAILPGGRVVTAVEAFRQIYRALGMGWLLAPTGWPIIRPIADAFYRFFAKHIRPHLSCRKCGRGESCNIRKP